MILIVNVCKEKLHENEFVRPVEEIVKKAGHKLFTRKFDQVFEEDMNEAEKIIICGTALKDFEYLDNIQKFNWIKDSKKPILGICAGMQLIGKVFGCELVDKEVIGQNEVMKLHANDLTEEESFFAYFLNTKSLKLNNNFEVLARGKEIDAIIKHKSKRIYACLFHPEVMNSDIIVNFCKL